MGWADERDYEGEGYAGGGWRRSGGSYRRTGDGPREEHRLEVRGRVLRRTGKAVLLQQADGREAWLPVSQIRETVETADGGVILSIPAWLASRNGLGV